MRNIFGSAVDLSEALAKDAKKKDLQQLSERDFCIFASHVEYWDDENDRCSIATYSREGVSWASARVEPKSILDLLNRPCYYNLNKSLVPGVRVTIPLMWSIRLKEPGFPPCFEAFYKEGRSNFEVYCGNATSYFTSEIVQDFYRWFVSPNQNPLLKTALKYMDNFTVHTHDNGRICGFSYTAKGSYNHRVLGALHTLSRFVWDGYYSSVLQNRAKDLVFWRDAGFSMRVSVPLAEARNAGSGAGHLVFQFSPNILFNWLTENIDTDADDWNFMYDRRTQYPLPTPITPNSLREYLDNLKKKGFELGPTSKK